MLLGGKQNNMPMRLILCGNRFCARMKDEMGSSRNSTQLCQLLLWCVIVHKCDSNYCSLAFFASYAIGYNYQQNHWQPRNILNIIRTSWEPFFHEWLPHGLSKWHNHMGRGWLDGYFPRKKSAFAGMSFTKAPRRKTAPTEYNF